MHKYKEGPWKRKKDIIVPCEQTYSPETDSKVKEIYKMIPEKKFKIKILWKLIKMSENTERQLNKMKK
jgi:hypothetical protein